MKNKFVKQIVQVVIVILSGICAYKIPIATKYFNINSEKILTGFDIAIFNTILNIIWETIYEFYRNRRMIVEIRFEFENQNSNSLVLYENDENKAFGIKMIINISGKKRRYGKKLTLVCPDSFLLQIQKKNNSVFIKEVEASEKYELDINKLVEKSSIDSIQLSREIRFTLSMEEHNKGNIDTIGLIKSNDFGIVSIKSEKMKIIQK